MAAVTTEGVGVTCKLYSAWIAKAGSILAGTVLEAAIREDDTVSTSGSVADLQITTQVQRAQRHGCAYT